MPEAANALHGHQISGAETGIAKGVVSRDTRAKERGGFRRTKLVGNGGDATRLGDHYFGISSIDGNPRHDWVLAIHGISAPAWFADSVFTTEEAHADSLTDFPSSHAGTQRINAPHHFVARNARQRQPRPCARDRGGITVANTASFHTNPHLASARFLDWPFHQAKRARCGYFHGLVVVLHAYLLSLKMTDQTNRGHSASRDFFDFHIPLASMEAWGS